MLTGQGADACGLQLLWNGGCAQGLLSQPPPGAGPVGSVPSVALPASPPLGVNAPQGSRTPPPSRDLNFADLSPPMAAPSTPSGGGLPASQVRSALCRATEPRASTARLRPTPHHLLLTFNPLQPLTILLLR